MGSHSSAAAVDSPSLPSSLTGGWDCSWDDDVVFKNCAKTEDKNQVRSLQCPRSSRSHGVWVQPDTFINDTLRSDYHRRFMDKFIK